RVALPRGTEGRVVAAVQDLTAGRRVGIAPALRRVEEARGALTPGDALRREARLDAVRDVEQILDADEGPLGDRLGAVLAQSLDARAQIGDRRLGVGDGRQRGDEEEDG